MSGFLHTMSFREKSLWVQIAVYVYAWIWYFGKVGNGLFEGTLTREDTFSLFLGMTVTLIVLSIVSQIVLSIVSQGDADAPADERDRLIAQKAGNYSAYMLGFGVVMIAIYAMLNDVSSIFMVHTLVLLLIAVEILTDALQILYYRRGH